MAQCVFGSRGWIVHVNNGSNLLREWSYLNKMPYKMSGLTMHTKKTKREKDREKEKEGGWGKRYRVGRWETANNRHCGMSYTNTIIWMMYSKLRSFECTMKLQCNTHVFINRQKQNICNWLCLNCSCNWMHMVFLTLMVNLSSEIGKYHLEMANIIPIKYPVSIKFSAKL